MRDPYEHYPQNRPMPHPGTGDDVHLQNVLFHERADGSLAAMQQAAEELIQQPLAALAKGAAWAA